MKLAIIFTIGHILFAFNYEQKESKTLSLLPKQNKHKQNKCKEVKICIESWTFESQAKHNIQLLFFVKTYNLYLFQGEMLTSALQGRDTL